MFVNWGRSGLCSLVGHDTNVGACQEQEQLFQYEYIRIYKLYA